ncbi:hypothetical protein OXX79_000754, partial [Metschnikowia pulcherrima]
MMCQKEGK